MNISMKTSDLQKQMTDDMSVLQNIIHMPIIEIEQLNPRIVGVQGVMAIRYRKKGGDIDTELAYEYEWVAGELYFVESPFARKQQGTGKVGFVCDDERDPAGLQNPEDPNSPIIPPIPVPEGAKSGAQFGWNKEFLASHYGECYWKILDPEIDKEVQDRYYNILINLAIEKSTDKKLTEAIKEEAKEKVGRAVAEQSKGISGTNVKISRVSNTPFVVTQQRGLQQGIPRQDTGDLTQELIRENAELKARLDSQPEKKEPNGKKKMTKKERSEHLSRKAKENWAKRKAVMAAAPTGNLGG